ncbi:MAG TPA: hypothetical protein VGV38_04000 [Pyrinomonadaceae bacterium]|nr:hypothetical protein [Pyrinomonadaceae bacterium]
MSQSVTHQSAIRNPQSAIPGVRNPQSAIERGRPLVVEVAGPAGAGKSELARALAGRDAGVSQSLGVWGLPWAALAAGALSSLPLLASLCGRRQVGRGEAALLVRLRALYGLLGRASGVEHATLLLDEGAVFALAKLDAYGRAAGEGKSAASHDEAGRSDRRSSELFTRWAARLDAVVWLDAPDTVLARRIRERAKPHRMKDRPDAEVFEFLARYRAAYARVLSELERRNGLRVLRFSTESESAESLAGRVLASLRGECVTA